MLLISVFISLPLVVFAKDALTHAYPVEVVEVKDGDTIKVRVHQWLDTWLITMVRIKGVDTPEKGWRAKCDYERELAQASLAFTTAFVKSGAFTIFDISHDKYGGRVVETFVRDGGANLGELLIKNGYGTMYSGKTKQSWCDNNFNEEAL